MSASIPRTTPDLRDGPHVRELFALLKKFHAHPRGADLRAVIGEIAAHFGSDPCRHPSALRVKPRLFPTAWPRTVWTRWEMHWRGQALELEGGEELGRWSFITPLPDTREVIFMTHTGVEVFQSFSPHEYEALYV